MSGTKKTKADGAAFRAEVDNKLLHSVAAEPATANTKELYKALSQVARDQLAQRWVDTQVADRRKKTRRIYYMSMEFLIGRTLNNARQRRPRPPGRLFPRLDGHPRTAVLGLWHAL
jgi:glucan phosphorylase